MKGRFDSWPTTWRDDTIPYAAGCLVCARPCSEPGWLQIEAIATGVCRCCIDFLFGALPEHVRADLVAMARPRRNKSRKETRNEP